MPVSVYRRRPVPHTSLTGRPPAAEAVTSTPRIGCLAASKRCPNPATKAESGMLKRSPGGMRDFVTR